MQKTEQRVVDVSYTAFRVERQHAGWNAFQDGLDVAAALFQFLIGLRQLTAGSYDLAAAGLQFVRHAVEGAHQVSEFIGRPYLDAIIQPPAGNLLGAFGQSRHRTGHQLGQKQREPGSRE